MSLALPLPSRVTATGKYQTKRTRAAVPSLFFLYCVPTVEYSLALLFLRAENARHALPPSPRFNPEAKTSIHPHIRTHPTQLGPPLARPPLAQSICIPGFEVQNRRSAREGRREEQQLFMMTRACGGTGEGKERKAIFGR